MAYVVDPLNPNDPGFGKQPIPAWAKNLKNKATNNSSADDREMTNMQNKGMQLTQAQIQEAHANRIDAPSGNGRALSDDEIAEAHANALPHEQGSNAPDFSKDPAGYLESLIPTGQTFMNLGKDALSALGTTGQNLLNFGSQMSAVAPFQPPSTQAALTPQGQQIISDTQKSISPITQYDIPYHLNAPMTYGHKLLRGFLGALPLGLVAGPEAGMAENALVGGAGSVAISDPKTASDAKSEAISGALIGGITHGLIKAGGKASDYVFAKSGVPVNQAKEDIRANEDFKNSQLQQLEAVQEPVGDEESTKFANQNLAGFANEFNSKLNNATDGEGDIQDYIAKNNSSLKGQQEAEFDKSQENDNRPIPDQVAFDMMQPAHIQSLDAWDTAPGANTRSAFQSLPPELQTSLISKFQKPDEVQKQFAYLFENPKAQPSQSSLDQLKSALIQSKQNPMDAIQGKSIPDLIDGLESPQEKAMAIKSMYARGLISPNAGRVLDSLFPDDIKDVLNFPGGFVKTQKTDLERPKATLKDARDYAKAAKVSAKSAETNDFKRTHLVDLARHVEQKVLEPSMDYYDKRLNTKTLQSFRLGKQITQHDTAPFKATKDTEKLANGALVKPSLERISKILKSGKEQLNNFKLGKKLDKNETNLHPSEIPDSHVLSNMFDQVNELKKYHANPDLKGMSEGKFSGSAKDQLKAFEKAFASGKLDRSDPIAQKHYDPLKHYVDTERNAQKMQDQNYRINKKEILDEAASRREALQDALKKKKDLQDKLNKNPSLAQSILMNHARGFQLAASAARVAKPLGYGLINSQNQ